MKPGVACPSRAWAGSRSARTRRERVRPLAERRERCSPDRLENLSRDDKRRRVSRRRLSRPDSRTLAVATDHTRRRDGHAFLPASRRRSPQAAHRLPGERNPAHRGGDGPRRIHRQRVHPLPPAVAMPGEGARRVHADRARGMGSRHPRAPADDDVRGRFGRRRDLRAANPDVEPGRRDLPLPAGLVDGLLLPERRGRRGDLRPRGPGNAGDDLRGRALQGRGLPRDPARHDLPLRSRRPAASPRLRDAWLDRDSEALPEPVRTDSRRRSVLPPRHPPALGAEDIPGTRRLPREGARPRRVPGVRSRLSPLRRRRLGRLPVSVDVLDPRLRADHGSDPPAAALAPDLPGPELRHLLVLPAGSSTSTRMRCRFPITTRICSRRR